MDTQLQQEILAALGIEMFPEEEATDMLDRVTELVMNNLLLSAVEQLPADQLDAYTELIATDPDPDTVFNFFKDHIENFDDIVSNSVASVAEAFRK